MSTDVLSQLGLFAEYSAAAYCSNNINSTGDALSCEEGNCPSVQSADTTTLWEFDRYEFKRFQGTFHLFCLSGLAHTATSLASLLSIKPTNFSLSPSAAVGPSVIGLQISTLA